MNQLSADEPDLRCHAAQIVGRQLLHRETNPPQTLQPVTSSGVGGAGE
jgi:hypothetical protein